MAARGGRARVLIAACLYYSGIVPFCRWAARFGEPRLIILNFHQATGGSLRRHLLYLRRHYHLVSLEAALESLHGPRRAQRGNGRTSLAVTFDDGYHDNYTHAFPLAQELQIPITIFLIPGYLDSGDHFWWLETKRLARRATGESLTVAGLPYCPDQETQRADLADAIDRGARYATSVTERESFIASIRETLAVSGEVSADERAAQPLTWAQVQEMEASGWVSYGAHTMHHPVLAYLMSPAEVEHEVRVCRVALEKRLGHPIHTFAYPMGKPEHIGDHARSVVERAGYRWATTTVPGFNTSRTDPYLLRRNGTDVGEHWLVLAAQTAGVWSFLVGMCRGAQRRLHRTVAFLRALRTRGPNEEDAAAPRSGTEATRWASGPVLPSRQGHGCQQSAGSGQHRSAGWRECAR